MMWRHHPGIYLHLSRPCVLRLRDYYCNLFFLVFCGTCPLPDSGLWFWNPKSQSGSLCFDAPYLINNHCLRILHPQPEVWRSTSRKKCILSFQPFSDVLSACVFMTNAIPFSSYLYPLCYFCASEENVCSFRVGNTVSSFSCSFFPPCRMSTTEMITKPALNMWLWLFFQGSFGPRTGILKLLGSVYQASLWEKKKKAKIQISVRCSVMFPRRWDQLANMPFQL